MADFTFGMIGLGVMGANLARNLARNGFGVAGYDLDEDKRRTFEAFNNEGPLTSFSDDSTLVKALPTPRRLILLVPAGVVDSALAALTPLLDPGDLVIDMGNSFFLDTERRAASLEQQGLLFMGCGVSGGEKGALHGPSIMPGGSPEAYTLVRPAFEAIAAQVGGEPCVTHVGPRGAGHYVKMVHNGIEYGLMQSIAEAYDLLRRVVHASPSELQQTFSAWNQMELNAYLIQITADIFSRIDSETGIPLVDLIVDEAQQKGTGRWTSQNALDLGMPAHTLTAAVDSRIISGMKAQRLAAESRLRGPEIAYTGSRTEFFDLVRQALYASILCAYAQGLAILQAASQEYDYHLNLADIARIWRGGCIIRAALLEDIRSAYAAGENLPNLLLAEPFRTQITERQAAWRKVIQIAVASGIPVPAMAHSLAYFDAYRTGRLPANLIQAQRDYFGSHTYRRTDRPGIFHTEWET